MKIFVSLLVLCVFLGGCGYSGEESVSDVEEIQLGFIAPLTGKISNLGNDTLTSAMLAVEEVNANGGINGVPLKLIVEDGQCDAGEGAKAGNKLMNVDGVPVVFVMCSPEIIAAAPIATQTETVLLSSCASAPSVTDAGDFVFRSYPSDEFQGRYAAEYIYTALGVKKVGVFAMQNDWGIGLSDVFIETFESLGGEIVAKEVAAPEDRDLRAQLTKLKNSEAELLYVPAFTQLTLAFLKQASELSIDMPLFGGDAWSDTAVHDSPYAEGIQYLIPRAQFADEWKTAMESRGANPTVCSPTAYDNVNIIADIISRVGSDTVKIKDQLYAVQGYDGVNGIISFDENGDLKTAEYDVMEVKGGVAAKVE